MSTIVASRGGWRYFPVLPLVFAAIHFAWGLGFWYGLVLIPFSKTPYRRKVLNTDKFKPL